MEIEGNKGFKIMPSAHKVFDKMNEKMKKTVFTFGGVEKGGHLPQAAPKWARAFLFSTVISILLSVNLGFVLNHGEVKWVFVTSYPPEDLYIDEVDPDDLAKVFVDHYYSTFDANPAGLANVYQESSMLTFEGRKIQGAKNIVAKLTGLPFQKCQHSISTIDSQPSGSDGGILVFVSGNLQIPRQQHAVKFSQMFHLMPTPQGSFYVLNDIFRLIYG